MAGTGQTTRFKHLALCDLPKKFCWEEKKINTMIEVIVVPYLSSSFVSELRCWVDPAEFRETITAEASKMAIC